MNKNTPKLEINVCFRSQNHYDLERLDNEYIHFSDLGTHLIMPTIIGKDKHNLKSLYKHNCTNFGVHESDEILAMYSIYDLHPKNLVTHLILFDYLGFDEKEIVYLYHLVYDYDQDLYVTILEDNYGSYQTRSFKLAQQNKSSGQIPSFISSNPKNAAGKYYYNFLTDPTLKILI
ncbi:MAG: hypothetical protein CL670_07350 [Balneola sp.]|jgi:hypothetical protein|nr:hypothetical protein [Balneola sp.]MBE78951.1 hypothetical protein [Balneola sp.]|tara:strand:+ start:414 stop:938 length:525 start_codon:yes stop_codon:yes gene_type:complete